MKIKKTNHIFFIAIGISIVTVAAFILSLANVFNSGKKTDATVLKPGVGMKAPVFSADAVSGGNVSLSNFSGKPIVLTFLFGSDACALDCFGCARKRYS